MRQKSAENIIFYDGICALCNFWVRFVLWADTSEEFHFCALQSEGARKMLPSSVSDPSNLRTIILKAEGQTFKKSDAVLKIFQKLGLPWSLMSIFFLVPRPGMTNARYHPRKFDTALSAKLRRRCPFVSGPDLMDCDAGTTDPSCISIKSENKL